MYEESEGEKDSRNCRGMWGKRQAEGVQRPVRKGQNSSSSSLGEVVGKQAAGGRQCCRVAK